MYALIMAGGKGTRLGMGEKGLVRLCDIPLIEYVLTAVLGAGLTPVVITTPMTPYTANYCRAHEVDIICTEGNGYVEDITEAALFLQEDGPLMIICADVPGIRSHHLCTILKIYAEEKKTACSTWIPARFLGERGGIHRYSREIEGVCAIPVGVNILLGSRIREEQEETQILLTDPHLAFNINTPPELSVAETVFSRARTDP